MASQPLANSFLGPAYSLATNPASHIAGLHAAPNTQSSLLWSIVTCAEDPSKVNICTIIHGQRKCLDIYNDNTSDRTRVVLADPGYYSGQMWTLIRQDNQYCKLENGFTGPGWYLDTYSDTYEAFMSQGNHSGQYWEIGSYVTHAATDGGGGHEYDHQHLAGKVAGGAAAAYVAGKVFKKFT